MPSSSDERRNPSTTSSTSGAIAIGLRASASGDRSDLATSRRSSSSRSILVAERWINVACWQYDHVTFVSAFGHERPHDNVAYEIFYPSGPFALLPMLSATEGLGRSAIVWSVTRKDAAGMLKLSDRAFLAEAEKKMGGLLGKLLPAAPRSSYPLGFHHELCSFFAIRPAYAPGA